MSARKINRKVLSALVADMLNRPGIPDSARSSLVRWTPEAIEQATDEKLEGLIDWMRQLDAHLKVSAPAPVQPAEPETWMLESVPMVDGKTPRLQEPASAQIIVAVAQTVKKPSNNHTLSLETLRKKIATLPTVKEKVAGIVLHFARFPEGALKRERENIEAVSAIVFDFDGRGKDPDTVLRADFEARCRDLGIACLTWATFSSPDDPTGCTFRALLPLAKEISPGQYMPAWHAAANLVGLSPQKPLPATQGYFCQARPDHSCEPLLIEGKALDLSHIGAEEMPAKASAEAPVRFPLTEQQIADAKSALAFLRSTGAHNADGSGRWYPIIAALSPYGDVGLALAMEFSEGGIDDKGADIFDAADVRKRFNQKVRANVDTGIGALFNHAAKAGWENPGKGRKVGPRVEPFEQGGSFITWGNSVQMVKTDWFWKYRLAVGALHLIGGTPGTGKSTIAFTWAAAISSGGTLPDGTSAPKGKVLIWSGEDSYEATIKPRLVAAGADMANIGFLNQPREIKDGEKVDFNPATHLPDLMKEIEAMPSGEVAMLIIDPIVTVIGGKDNNSTSEVRAALAPLVAMLAKLRIVGLGIMHFTKGSENKDPKDRFNGSSGYIALARVGFAAVKDQNETGRHIVTVVKSNIGPEGGGYNYHIEQVEVTDPKVGVIETSKVVWGDTLEGDARDLIRDAEIAQRERPANKLNQAKTLLRELLADGPRLVAEIEAAAEDAGISWRTINTAKREIGVVSERADLNDKRSPYHWLIRIADFGQGADDVNA